MEPEVQRGFVRAAVPVGLALVCLLVILLASSRLSDRNRQTRALPAAQDEGQLQTEVDFGTEVEIGPWSAISEQTHDVKEANNATGVPDQRYAVIFPGGELALDYSEGEYVSEGSRKTLTVVGTRGDKTPYTIFARSESASPWVHLDANRDGFPQGSASHDIRRQRVRQIRIRNDGTTNLFIDAVVVTTRPQGAVPSRDVQQSGPRQAEASGPSPPVSAVQPSVSVPMATAELPAARDKSGAEADPVRPGNGLPASADGREGLDASQAVPVPPTPATPVRPENEVEVRINVVPANGLAVAAEGQESPPPTSEAAVKRNGKVEPPKKIRGVPPDYPLIAQVANAQGTVVIDALVDASGKVKSARVRNSIPLLDKAALDAVKQWEFTPALLNGRPVPANMTLTIKFSLR
jgi:periplasmic protein TonB